MWKALKENAAMHGVFSSFPTGIMDHPGWGGRLMKMVRPTGVKMGDLTVGSYGTAE